MNTDEIKTRILLLLPRERAAQWSLLRLRGKDTLSCLAQLKLEWIISYHTVFEKNAKRTALHFGISGLAALDALQYGGRPFESHSAKEMQGKSVSRAVVFGLIGAGITAFSLLHGGDFSSTQGVEFGVATIAAMDAVGYGINRRRARN